MLRPCDAHETVEAWRVILEDLEGPAVLILSRQDLPVLDRESGEFAPSSGVAKGAYVLSDADDAEAIIIATGSEVAVALAARDELDVPVRVVSMPSWELFEQQDDDYQESVLPVDLPTVSVEAGIRQGWERYADAIVSIDRFGASAPGANGARGARHHARERRRAGARAARRRLIGATRCVRQRGNARRRLLHRTPGRALRDPYLARNVLTRVAKFVSGWNRNA